MRRVITSLFIAGCILSTAVAFQARSGGTAAGKACALLPRDLVLKILPADRKKELDRAKPEVDPFAEDLKAAGRPVRPGMFCQYGPVMLDLDGLAKPADVRKALSARAKGYEKFEPVAGVGDAAFVRTNSAFASMYVFAGSHHFTVELGAGPVGDAAGLKPNAIELARGIVALLR